MASGSIGDVNVWLDGGTDSGDNSGDAVLQEQAKQTKYVLKSHFYKTLYHNKIINVIT